MRVGAELLSAALLPCCWHTAELHQHGGMQPQDIPIRAVSEPHRRVPDVRPVSPKLRKSQGPSPSFQLIFPTGKPIGFKLLPEQGLSKI